MKIYIKQGNGVLQLSDDMEDDDDIVDICVEYRDKGVCMEVSIDELFFALIAFDSKRARRRDQIDG